MSTQFDLLRECERRIVCSTGRSHGPLVPSGEIVAREELIKADQTTAENCLGYSLGFRRRRRSQAHEASRLPMTADGTVTGDTEKKMTGFVLKTVRRK